MTGSEDMDSWSVATGKQQMSGAMLTDIKSERSGRLVYLSLVEIR